MISPTRGGGRDCGVLGVNPLDTATLIGNLSPIGMVAMALLALVKGWVVTARELRDRDATIERLLRERDEWQRVAVKAISLSERTVSIAEEADR